MRNVWDYVCIYRYENKSEFKIVLIKSKTEVTEAEVNHFEKLPIYFCVWLLD